MTKVHSMVVAKAKMKAVLWVYLMATMSVAQKEAKRVQKMDP